MAAGRNLGAAGILAGAALALLMACGNPQPPPTRQLLNLTGSPYQRGLQHGTQLADDIRAFYTTLLTTSLLPYLNREQGPIAAVLPRYAGPEYQNGQFATQLLLDSAHQMELSIPAEYRQEMQGIADGSGLSYDQILLLNTFADTTLAVRAVDTALQYSAAPHLQSVEFLGVDAGAWGGGSSDSGGQNPEVVSSVLTPYVASPMASATDLPITVGIRFTIADPAGVDPSSVRVTLGSAVFVASDPALEILPLASDGSELQVTLTPPALLPAASVVTASILAANVTVVSNPPPAHERFMREERIAFTTVGAGLKAYQVPNRGTADASHPPTSIAFAVTGSATPDGAPRLAQHFALLDANTSHNHTAVFVHHPDTGAPFAVVGWAGIAWGFSGLNAGGQAYACQPSDTLDNSAVGTVLNSAGDLASAQLLVSGTPIGFAGRQILEGTTTSDGAVAMLRGLTLAYGWNCLLADAAGDLRAVELDSGLSGQPALASYSSDPTVSSNLNANGQPWASLGPDDLRFATHYLKNQSDMFSLTVSGERLLPQPGWAPSYFASLTTDASLGDALSAVLGQVDSNQAMSLLSRPELVDPDNSMNAVVIEPATRTLYSAMGTEPATDSPFEALVVPVGGP